MTSGPSKRQAGVQDTLRRRAIRWLECAGDAYPPTDGDVLLDKITDELLVVASDVVATAATEDSHSISGKARLRLLAWLVADARGAGWWGYDVDGLSKAEAEKVGKRLNRQAQKVRDELAAAREAAHADRTRVEAGGGDDSCLAAINAMEQVAINRARDEVYVGYNELESLMPGPDPAMPPEPRPELLALETEPEPKHTAPLADPTPAQASTKEKILELYEALESRGVRCPYRLTPDFEEDKSIPQDLAQALGHEATQELYAKASTATKGDAWWEIELPSFVLRLLAERANLVRDHQAD